MKDKEKTRNGYSETPLDGVHRTVLGGGLPPEEDRPIHFPGCPKWWWDLPGTPAEEEEASRGAVAVAAGGGQGPNPPDPPNPPGPGQPGDFSEDDGSDEGYNRLCGECIERYYTLPSFSLMEAGLYSPQKKSISAVEVYLQFQREQSMEDILEPREDQSRGIGMCECAASRYQEERENPTLEGNEVEGGREYQQPA